MGGHGGLNILPQKKWNVYNHDNRAIVQKDKKLYSQKKRNQFQLQRQHKLQQKIQFLKDQEQRQKPQYQKNIQKVDTLIGSQLKRLNEQNKHVNLFEKQEQIILNRQLLQCQKLKEEQWLKDKNMDYSSKFLGTYNNQQKLPWYLKSKQQGYKIYKNKNLQKNNYQMKLLLDNNKQQNIHPMQFSQKTGQNRSQMRQRSRQKKLNFLRQKQIQNINLIKNKQRQANNFCKIKKESNQINSKNLVDSNNSQSLQQLRAKRLKRQLKEKKRVEQLKKKIETQKID